MNVTATRQPGPQRRRARRAGQTIATLAACALLATACTHSSADPGVANARSSTPTGVTSASGSSSSSGGASASRSPYDQAVAYAACMRTHGIADFPDPDSSGNIDLKSLHPAAGSDLDPNDPRFKAALTACKSLQPTQSAAQQDQDAAQALKWAQCFRAHGVPNFPDPDSNGRISVGSLRRAGIDTNPQFQAAAAACAQYQPTSIHVPGGAGS